MDIDYADNMLLWVWNTSSYLFYSLRLLQTIVLVANFWVRVLWCLVILCQITDGERLTLTLWFSRDASHDEDAKLVSLLSQSLLHHKMPGECLPLLASSNMYWFSPSQTSHQQLGFDICWARLHILGFDVYSYEDRSSDSDFSELPMKPLQLARENELLDHEFVNILHALQVFQLILLHSYFLDVYGDSKWICSYVDFKKGPMSFTWSSLCNLFTNTDKNFLYWFVFSPQWFLLFLTIHRNNFFTSSLTFSSP